MMLLEDAELNDANYTWTEDPFAPDWEIVAWQVVMELAWNPKNMHYHLPIINYGA
jgi:hypothetical protein